VGMECPWCGLDYVVTMASEEAHLVVCKVFQGLPVAYTAGDGRTFVALPENENVLCERVRVC
jgi:hypothetical protein